MVSNIFYLHPENWGRFPFWLIFFGRVVQPSTRIVVILFLWSNILTYTQTCEFIAWVRLFFLPKATKLKHIPFVNTWSKASCFKTSPPKKKRRSSLVPMVTKFKLFKLLKFDLTDLGVKSVNEDVCLQDHAGSYSSISHSQGNDMYTCNICGLQLV